MTEWVLAQEGIVIYATLFLLLMGGALFLPVPEDLPLILGGVFIQLEKSRPEMIFLVCYIGILVGDITIFSVGRYLGPRVFSLRWFRSPRARARSRKVRIGLQRRSLITILVARHLFYLRTLTFLTCGALRMSYTRFIVSDCIAALVSVPIMLSIGYAAAEHYDAVLEAFDWAKEISLILVIVLVLGYTAFHIYKERRAEEDLEEVIDAFPPETDQLEPDQLAGGQKQ